ncbi:MAG: hypothetical protein ACRC2T_14005, partial [Thermoguttaceae bacterium]
MNETQEAIERVKPLIIKEQVRFMRFPYFCATVGVLGSLFIFSILTVKVVFSANKTNSGFIFLLFVICFIGFGLYKMRQTLKEYAQPFTEDLDFLTSEPKTADDFTRRAGIFFTYGDENKAAQADFEHALKLEP